MPAPFQALMPGGRAYHVMMAQTSSEAFTTSYARQISRGAHSERRCVLGSSISSPRTAPSAGTASRVGASSCPSALEVASVSESPTCRVPAWPPWSSTHVHGPGALLSARNSGAQTGFALGTLDVRDFMGPIQKGKGATLGPPLPLPLGCASHPSRDAPGHSWPKPPPSFPRFGPSTALEAPAAPLHRGSGVGSLCSPRK